MATARESFRARIKKGISGSEVSVLKSELLSFLSCVENILIDGIDRARQCNEGVIPTYLTYAASEYEELGYITPYGLKAVRVKAFELHKVPDFLEAPARSLKIGSVEENINLYNKIRASELYDAPLKNITKQAAN